MTLSKLFTHACASVYEAVQIGISASWELNRHSTRHTGPVSYGPLWLGKDFSILASSLHVIKTLYTILKYEMHVQRRTHSLLKHVECKFLSYIKCSYYTAQLALVDLNSALSLHSFFDYRHRHSTTLIFFSEHHKSLISTYITLPLQSTSWFMPTTSFYIINLLHALLIPIT